MNALSRAAALAMLCAAAGGVWAQDRAGAPDQYLPLFTPEMIRKASPQQAARMRATEARNRAAWEQRQAEARARAEAAARPPPEAPPPQRRGNKIYKWVDKDGNVHFGDAPAGDGAEEVQVGGAARQRGRPLPPPSLGGGESPPRE